MLRNLTLHEVILHLRHLQSAVIVAIAALRRQSCELDEDVARLLQRRGCDGIEEQRQKREAAASGARPATVPGRQSPQRRA